jgi:hypothetical protein
LPESKKTAKAPKAKAAKPKVVKTKPASTVKNGFSAKPKADIAKAPKVAKPVVKATVEVKVKKTRGPRKAKGTFADLLKKQAELEEIKKGAKVELKKEYDGFLKEADKVKAQYKELFSESIESLPKARGTGSKKTAGKILGLKPFTLKEVEDFVEQKQQGISEIKVQGRRPKSISRLEDAYRHSEDAEEILKLLNK